MNKRGHRKRILICTFIAITSSLFGAVLGVQINLAAQNYRCERQVKVIPIWGVKALCQWEVPGAVMGGGMTGLWVGMVLGAFVGGLTTRRCVGESDRSPLDRER